MAQFRLLVYPLCYETECGIKRTLPPPATYALLGVFKMRKTSFPTGVQLLDLSRSVVLSAGNSISISLSSQATIMNNSAFQEAILPVQSSL